MNEIIRINNNELKVKKWNGQRVVTLADIDKVHERPAGTAKRNFNENKKHLIINEDYFLITRKELSTKIVPNNEPLKGNPNIKVVLLTEMGYLLLVKSLTDVLAWKVQRDLVNCYFKFQELEPRANEIFLQQDLKVAFVQINNIETMIEEQQERLEKVLDNITLTTTQQGEIHREAKNRINFLLGGAHSQEYKKYAQMYFINLWNNLKEKFNCGSRWQDLNPLFYENAIDFIKNWEYRSSKKKV